MKPHRVENSRSAAALWRRRAIQVLSGAVLAAAMPLAQANSYTTPYTLTDQNSTITVDSASNDGISHWMVDGVDQLYQQWFWGRIGSTSGESSLDTLTLLNGGPSDSNFNGDNNHLWLKYGDGTTIDDSTFTIALDLNLMGGAPGSKMSDLATQVTFSNLTDTGKDLHVFQYSDFDLSDNYANDTGTAVNANTIVQSDGGMILTDAVSPTPSKWEIGPYSDIVDSLGNASPTTLGNSGSGMVGDVTYARQWDFTLQPKGGANSSFGFSIDQHITVPDPGTILLLGAGMLGLAGANRRKRRKDQAVGRD